jgi:hypothetical protein
VLCPRARRGIPEEHHVRADTDARDAACALLRVLP